MAFKKYLVVILSTLIIYSVNGQKPKKVTIQLTLYQKAILAFKRGKWDTARKLYLLTLEKGTSKDSIDILKNNIVNCNFIIDYDKKARTALLEGRENIGVVFLEKMLKISPDNKILKKRLLSYYIKKRKQAIRNKAYAVANEYLNHSQELDSTFNKVKYISEIVNSKKLTTEKILSKLNLNKKDTITIEKKLIDSLEKLNYSYAVKQLSRDSVKLKGGIIHFGVITGIGYALPELTSLNGTFDRIYLQPSRFIGIKVTLGRLTSHFSFSTEYRLAEYKFNTFYYSTERKINLEDFNIETTDIPIYTNYQIKSLFGTNVFSISLGGVIHQIRAMKYYNNLENRYLNNGDNIANTWYSGMVGMSYQKKIFKKLKVELALKFNKGFGSFLNVDKINSFFVPSQYYPNKTNENPLTSTKMNSVNASVALIF
ncbi:hypothetical protein LV89_02119 [Arcicella aurantiaca]|uniref:Uncharacterized protein n=1 Tax=Arcicella aurantiaca TaxID=591202 RepID=A0A316EA90_9BACT|nr:hypothetical protein [Arcicella aurantiaca]PWK26913.1 hypothetical protein LV89_02119 [Arcicella aurantiaca]